MNGKSCLLHTCFQRRVKKTGRKCQKIDASRETEAHETALSAIYPKRCKIYPGIEHRGEAALAPV